MLVVALAIYGVYRYMDRSIESEQPTEVIVTDTIVAIEEVAE
jgi:hypothetical protein